MKTRYPVLAAMGFLALLCTPMEAGAGGCLYPTAGYLLHLSGNEDLGSAPSFGARFEYTFSGAARRAIGLVYSFSRHDVDDRPPGASVDQHFCMLGYRFSKDWRRLNFGSHLGTGAVIRDSRGGAQADFQVGFALQTGINMSISLAPWLEIGPDLSFLLASDADSWIFGGESSYFFYAGGHVGLYF